MTEVFRFQDGTVDPSLIQDVKILAELGEGQLEQIVGVVLRFLSTADSTVLVDGAEAFAEEHGVSASALRPPLLALLVFFKAAARKGMSKEHVAQDMQRFGLGESHSAAVAGMWGKHVNSLSQTMVDQTMSANRLVDLEWRFGVTAASSELESVGRTFLQLKMQMDGGGGEIQDQAIELTLPQFYDFLKEMEKAHAAMSLLSGA